MTGEQSISGWPEHANHGRWKRIAPCTYCACGARLYNGKPPKDRAGQRSMADVVEKIANRRGSND